MFLFSMKILKPHNKKARLAKESDIEKILKDAAKMMILCSEKLGKMGGAYAIAHPQVSKNPLSFFVTENGGICINPVIKKHTKTMVDSKEYCLSFSNENHPAIVKRWNVIEVEYYEIENNKFKKVYEKFCGKQAKIVQHEIDHLNAIYVYNNNRSSDTKSGKSNKKIPETNSRKYKENR